MRAHLSIIVTAYNKPPEQIIECMESIKEQTVKPLEVILVDDCSKDPRAHALATSIMLPKNVGVAEARNIGVRMSKGQLLLFLDADDKLAPDFIEQCGRVITNCDIAYPNVLKFGNVEINKLVDAPDNVDPAYIIGRGRTREFGLVVTSMIKREMYFTLGGFKDLPIFEDWDFWIRAMFNGYTFAKANTILYYRQNRPEDGSRNRNSLELKADIRRQITSPFEVKEGKLVKKGIDGKQKNQNTQGN